jgi:hypothetical protein
MSNLYNTNWGWVLNDVKQHVIKYWSHFCYKKEAFRIFLVIPKTGQTTESMRVVNFEIHLLPNRNCFLLQVFIQLWYILDTITLLFTHLEFAHSFSKYGAWNETEWNINSIFGVNVEEEFFVLGYQHELSVCFPL